MATQVITENTYLAGARNSLKKEDCMELYEKWAASYNDDLADASQNYIAPLLVAQAALASSKDPEATVLDAGCGTGLVAEALAKGSPWTIDGMDLSPAMLKVAEQTGVYRSLFKVDLTQPIDQPDQKYDIVTCCGTFTRGHVGPDPALREFIRLLKPNGTIVATVLEEIWVSGGYKAEADKLEAEGLAKVVSRDLIDYRKGAGDKATLLLMKKTGSA
ncbi:putative williams-beuren syndrome chromosome region [Aspergillus bombycis]|uniref:Putative williams-beuren syndrome chromosome region n=1 Tax=Aspergillus bombycis TaxID=109264 RepID=A0A1F8AA85_9EURO|nr:putative williams-beuren syndrome chromosome region [Aspergillus bombycis]OGM48640.1 putative williams-beuren syndrome chromosome region [Aspergillus bombycis]